MQTRITSLFGIRYPVICPGMTYVSNSTLVAAVSNAGGLGILAIGHLTVDETRAEIRRVRELTDKPFGIGVALIMPGARENLEVALEEQVPVVNFSLGNGADISPRVHAYGGKTIATVISAKHALSAEKAGVDALLVTGHEAAAHGGAVTSLVLIPAIREVTTLPMIAAGGFGTGGGLVAALALGADAVAMGTRWATSVDSPVHAKTKALIMDKNVEETIYNTHFDGMPCRVMQTPAAEKATAKPLTLWSAVWRSLQAARATGRPMFGLFSDVFRQGLTQAIKLAFFGAATLQIRQATIEGNHETGVQLIGQVQGLVHDIPNAEELMQRIMQEATDARARLVAVS